MRSILILLTLFAAATLQAATHHTIYIDAGSTGSRLHLFQYDDTQSRIPVIRDVLIESVEPGLAAYADHPDQAGPYLKKLFDSALNYAKQNNINPNEIKLNLFGTAGMRIIPAAKQNEIYTNIETWLRQQYAFNVNHIATISGKMEGVYGWLTVNYLLQNFQNQQPTTGTLEMGGASTQIAFETADDSKPEDTLDITVGKQHYHIFSKSFLNLGGDSVIRTLLQHPQAASCFPDGAAYKQSASGHFDETVCHDIYKNIIDDMHVADQVIPVHDRKFVAYGRFYYTYKFFDAVDAPHQSVLQAHVTSTCHQGWDTIKQANANVPEKLLLTYCPYGIYFGQMIYDAYRIDGSQLTLLEKAGDKKIEWTVGAVLFDLAVK